MSAAPCTGPSVLPELGLWLPCTPACPGCELHRPPMIERDRPASLPGQATIDDLLGGLT